MRNVDTSRGLCGVGAPGSGGGTPCATSLGEMEALLSCKEPTFVCVGQELENMTFFIREGRYKQQILVKLLCWSFLLGVEAFWGKELFLGELGCKLELKKGS